MRTLRSKDYLDFVRAHPCLVTDCELDVVAHHCRHKPHGGGVALKPSDYRTVPLTPLEHARLHQMGERAYWERAKIIPEIAMADMLCDWLHITYKVRIPTVHTLETALDYISAVEDFIRSRE